MQTESSFSLEKQKFLRPFCNSRCHRRRQLPEDSGFITLKSSGNWLEPTASECASSRLCSTSGTQPAQENRNRDWRPAFCEWDWEIVTAYTCNLQHSDMWAVVSILKFTSWMFDYLKPNCNATVGICRNSVASPCVRGVRGVRRQQ